MKMRNYNPLKKQFNIETGENADGYELSVTRMKREWVLDCTDKDILNIFYYTGVLEIPNPAYTKWLEQKILNL
jgi:hypothetical protein